MKTKTGTPCAVTVTGVVLAALVAAVVWALPATPDLDSWNENANKLDGTPAGRDAFIKQVIERLTYNCYNYAVNKKTPDANGKPKRAQPGKGQKWPNQGANLTRPQWCTKIKARSKGDGLTNIPWNPGDDIPTPPEGQNLVALGALPGHKGGATGPYGDYHWWRLNGDGSWSHKRGGTKAKTTYTDGNNQEQPLTDPRDANQRDGYSLCGFMGVPKDPTPDVGPLTVSSTCGPREEAVWVTPVERTGYWDAEMLLTPPEIFEVANFLPTFAPSNEVPDPEWPGVPAGLPAGFLMINLNATPELPLYTRAFQGVVEVYFGDLTETGMTYYNDDQGLEEFLQFFYQPTVGACCSEEGCLVTTECECVEFVWGQYLGDGSTCADCAAPCPWDCEPAPDGNVGVTDFLAMLAEWGQVGTSCDFDGGGVGITDFLKLLGEWGPCP
jgi:hypothetical protein